MTSEKKLDFASMSSGSAPAGVPTFTEIDYIAAVLYDADCHAQGYSASTRWWCTREDLRQKWREKAQQLYQQWSTAEKQMWDRRNKP